MFTDGRMFSVMVERGGGEGWYNVPCASERMNVDEGMGREMMEPNRAILAIHLDDSRGSNVRPAAIQYLKLDEQGISEPRWGEEQTRLRVQGKRT